MARQIGNAAQASAEHDAAQQRQAMLQQPQKQGRNDQIKVGPSKGFPSNPSEGHKFGPGCDGGDCSKLNTGM
jgi:hypothetical protein